MLPGIIRPPSFSRPTFTFGNSGTFGSATGVATLTGNSQNIGTASTDRYVILFMFGEDDATNFTVSSATVNGVSANIAVDYGGVSSLRSPAIGIANVPTGSSVSIVVNWSEVMTFNNQVVWLVVYGLSSLVPISTNTASITASTDFSTTADVVDYGLTAACVFRNQNTAATTWAAGTGFYDASNIDGSRRVSCSYISNGNPKAASTITGTSASSATGVIAAATFI